MHRIRLIGRLHTFFQVMAHHMTHHITHNITQKKRALRRVLGVSQG